MLKKYFTDSPNLKRHFKHLLLVLVLISFWGILSIKPTLCRSEITDDFKAVLKQSWEFYKQQFMVNGERVESNHYGGTISEGQSYALLKSVWMNDPETFEQVWKWTKDNMQRHTDHLFGWRWQKTSNGKGEIVEWDNATDADQDIAYALLIAGEKWNKKLYIEEAILIIKDLWKLDVESVKGKYYLVPGTWRGFREEYLTVNPSYFAPYVYRKFAQYDLPRSEGWKTLANETYITLEACSNLTTTKLPPNWCAIRWEDGYIVFSDKQGGNSRDFSYDAFRVFWRMALDFILDGEKNSRNYLKQHSFLIDYWNSKHILPEGFSPLGKPLGVEHSGFSASATLAQVGIVYPKNGHNFYQNILKPYYYSEGYWFNSYNDFLHSVIWLHLYTLHLQTQQ